jgi:hypothetical protein
MQRENALSLLHRYKKQKRLTHSGASVIRLRPHSANPSCSIDFVHEMLSNNRSCQMSTVLDE